MQDVRDKPVVALYFPSSHPPTLAFYTSLIAMHLASVGQEMGGTVFGVFCDLVRSFATNGTKHF